MMSKMRAWFVASILLASSIPSLLLTMVVWGCAKKGKIIAQSLLDAGVDFRWICNNPNKIGKHIYHTLIEGLGVMDELQNPQVIVAVANKDQQAEIREQYNETLFWFC